MEAFALKLDVDIKGIFVVNVQSLTNHLLAVGAVDALEQVPYFVVDSSVVFV